MDDQGAKVLYVLASIVVIGAGIKLAAPFLVPVLLALFIAIVTAPIVLWLCDRAVPRPLAVATGLLIDIAAGVGLSLPLIAAAGAFSDRIPDYQASLSIRLDAANTWLTSHGIHAEQLFNRDNPVWMVDMARTLVQTAASLGLQMVLVLLIVAFMLFEATGLRRKLVNAVVDRNQIEILSNAAREVNAYLVAKTILSLLTGVVVYAWCWFNDLDVPLLWGLLAYLLNFIPTIGQLIAAVPAIALAFIQFGAAPALIVAVGYGCINLAIGAIEPRVMGQTLGLSALVVLVSMVVWGFLLGPVGALLSAPLTMLIKHILHHTENLKWLAELIGPSPDPLAPRNSIPPFSKRPASSA